jgi:hypothetical protein
MAPRWKQHIYGSEKEHWKEAYIISLPYMRQFIAIMRETNVQGSVKWGGEVRQEKKGGGKGIE